MRLQSTMAIAIIAGVASTASAFGFDGSGMTKAQILAQKRQEQQQALAERRAQQQDVLAQRQAQLQQQRQEQTAALAQKRAEAQQQRELALQQRQAALQQRQAQLEQARQAKLTARQQSQSGFVGGFNGSYSSGGASMLAGHQCSARDTDPTVCKVCAIYGEDHNSQQGEAAVAGVIATRLQNGHWGNNTCAIVHGKGQFVGAWHRLPNNPALLGEIESNANAPANGYLGFRTNCGHGRSTRIGFHGNCYGEASIELDKNMTPEDVDAQGQSNYTQFADLFDSGEG